MAKEEFVQILQMSYSKNQFLKIVYQDLHNFGKFNFHSKINYFCIYSVFIEILDDVYENVQNFKKKLSSKQYVKICSKNA